ncbi:MAG TPA: hypothetical protein VGV93_01830 [Acidimicrobiales bacterium]|nr:hypothetical protein [Acidimicrobiales bacterium]
MPSEVTTSSTAAVAPDPAVIPDDLGEIDEEYVQAVVDELFAVDAKATEIFVTTKTLDERAIDHLEAIYVGEELEQQVDVWFQALAHRADELRVGRLQNSVQEIFHIGSDCVLFEVERDYSATTARESPPRRIIHLGLTPKRQGDDPEDLNPTGWVIFTSSVATGDSEPGNPCEGR